MIDPLNHAFPSPLDDFAIAACDSFLRMVLFGFAICLICAIGLLCAFVGYAVTRMVYAIRGIPYYAQPVQPPEKIHSN